MTFISDPIKFVLFHHLNISFYTSWLEMHVYFGYLYKNVHSWCAFTSQSNFAVSLCLSGLVFALAQTQLLGLTSSWQTEIGHSWTTLSDPQSSRGCTSKTKLSILLLLTLFILVCSFVSSGRTSPTNPQRGAVWVKRHRELHKELNRNQELTCIAVRHVSQHFGVFGISRAEIQGHMISLLTDTNMTN